MTAIELNTQQRAAIVDIQEWWRRGGQVLTVDGYAGTGKTTVVAQLPRALPGVRIAYCAVANKAVNVLRDKLARHGLAAKVSTLYALLYHKDRAHYVTCPECWQESEIELELRGNREVVPAVHRCGNCGQVFEPGRRVRVEIMRRSPRDRLDCDLVVVDEGSMVDSTDWRNLLRYGVKVLVVGDSFQLAPPKDEGFNLMTKPDIQMTEVMRNIGPVDGMATIVRNEGRLLFGEYGGGCEKVRWYDGMPGTTPGKDLMVLCHRKITRVEINGVVRDKLHRVGLPEPGDRVVACATNKKRGMFKNEFGTLTRVGDVEDDEEGNEFIYLEVELDEARAPVCGQAHLEQFNNPEELSGARALQFDYGYALTVNRAQGSEWKRVVVHERRQWYFGQEQYARWLYTAITRAQEWVRVVHGWDS